MTIPARTWHGGNVDLTALEQYERTYLGSDGYLYIDVDGDNPSAYHPGGDIYGWESGNIHESLQELRLEEINLKRLQRFNESAEELTTDQGEGCCFYEYSINGNGSADAYRTPEDAINALFLDMFPVGSRIYFTHEFAAKLLRDGDSDDTDTLLVGLTDRANLTEWSTYNLDLYGVKGKCGTLEFSDTDVDWQRTVDALEGDV